jgi:transcriptional regulator with XRE-family HTH domain
MPGRRSTPSVRLRRLAAQLRELRDGAGLTQEEVAERTGKDRSTLYRLEAAQVRPQRSTLIQLLDLYGVEGTRRDELLGLLKSADQRGWMQPYRSALPAVYSDYISFEDEAAAISNYESLFIPGLLQTADYARAQLRGTLPYASADDVEKRVTARMERQALLDRDSAPKLWAIIDEAAARRVVGGAVVMSAQLTRLVEADDRPNVTVQIIPFQAGAHPGMDGSFVVLEFEGAPEQTVIYTESAAGGLFLEEDAEVHRYMLMFEHLLSAALRPQASADLLAAIAAGHE